MNAWLDNSHSDIKSYEIMSGVVRKMEGRNSNIEILRIIAMFFIVVGHFVSQSGFQFDELSLNSYLLFIMSYGLRIACNVFLIIGVWFMVDTPFKANRIIKMYGQLVSYTLPLTLASIMAFPSLCTMKSIVKGLFPFSMRGLWFASAYLTLMLFAPLLNSILKWRKETVKLLAVLLLVFVSGVSSLPDQQDGYVVDTLWFLTVYIVIGYIKMYGRSFQNKKLAALISGGGYIALTTIVYCSKIYKESGILNTAGNLAYQYLIDIKTLPNFIIALALFVFFITKDEKHNGNVNRLAACAFPVYLFHQTPAFYPILWKYVFRVESWIERPYFYYPVIVFVCIYGIVLIIEQIRKKFIEPVYLKSKAVARVKKWLDAIYQDV